MVSVKPVRPLITTGARILNFIGWLALLTCISFGMSLLGLRAGGISTAVSLVILTYLIFRRNVTEIAVDTAKKLVLVRHVPWFGKEKVATYPINSLTEVSFVQAMAWVPFKGNQPTGRHKLVIKTPTRYKLEFFTSDFRDEDLDMLGRSISAAKPETLK